MSRYSPSVLPEYAGGNPGRDLADALANHVRMQEAARAAADAHDTASGAYVAGGGRYGTPPASAPAASPAPIAATAAPDFSRALADGFARQSPASPAPAAQSEFARALSAGMSGPAAASTAPDEDSTGGGWGTSMPSAPAASSSDFANALRNGMQPSNGAPAPAPRSTAGGGTPGAFDPALGGFTPAQRTAPAASAGPSVGDADPRYIATGPDRYIDTQHTRQAQQIALAQAMLEGRNAGAMDRVTANIGGRKEIAGMNNETRQNIADNRLASYDDAHADAIDSRERIAARRDETTRLGQAMRAANIGTAGKNITATAREANANKAASAFLNIYGGDYSAASDALKNTPEGQQLAASGVEPRHLYVAHGVQLGVDTKATVGMLRNSADVPKAVGKLGAARNAVLEAQMSDQDLWEAKVKGGMTKDQATEYVKKRKK